LTRVTSHVIIDKTDEVLHRSHILDLLQITETIGLIVFYIARPRSAALLGHFIQQGWIGLIEVSYW